MGHLNFPQLYWNKGPDSFLLCFPLSNQYYQIVYSCKTKDSIIYKQHNWKNCLRFLTLKLCIHLWRYSKPILAWSLVQNFLNTTNVTFCNNLIKKIFKPLKRDDDENKNVHILLPRVHTIFFKILYQNNPFPINFLWLAIIYKSYSRKNKELNTCHKVTK